MEQASDCLTDLINNYFIRSRMATSAVKQIILHQYHTLLHDDSHHTSKEPLPKMGKQRLKGNSHHPDIPIITRVHNSLNHNKNKPHLVDEANQIKFIPKSDTKHKLEKYQKRYRFHTEIKNYELSRVQTIENMDAKHKIKKIFLPNLKNFDDFDYETDRIRVTVEKQALTAHQRHGSHDRETNFPQLQNSIEQITPFRLKTEHTPNEKRQQPSIPSNAINPKKLYKYIEKIAKSDNGNIKARIKHDDEESRSVSSFSPSFQKQSNIIFHNFKAKGMDQAKTKHHSSFTQNEPVFNISKIKQNLDQFLMAYTPLNPKFDLKQFIRDSNVQIVATDKTIFAGRLVNGKMEGKGVLITAKQLFQGEFINNLKKEGFEKNKNGIYQGIYQMGKRNGSGKFVWRNGQSYEGEWRFGKKNGFGLWKSIKGDYYEGEWKDNLQNGKGCYYYRGCSMYRGYFKNSLKHGRGEEQFQNGDQYNGQYESGKPHGYGKYQWANGDTYVGYFAKGSRQGKGILRKQNGEVYDGEFKEDMKDGRGRETYPKGQYFEGRFQKGLKISGSYYSKENRVIQSY